MEMAERTQLWAEHKLWANMYSWYIGKGPKDTNSPADMFEWREAKISYREVAVLQCKHILLQVKALH